MKETTTRRLHFLPATSTKKCQPQTCGATNKRLHTVFVLSSCGASLRAAKVKHAPDLRRRLQFVMLVSRLLSTAPSHRLPLCCVSNTSSSSFICLFVQSALTPDNETAPHALRCHQVSHWKVWPNHSLTNYLHWFVFIGFTWSLPSWNTRTKKRQTELVAGEDFDVKHWDHLDAMLKKLTDWLKHLVLHLSCLRWNFRVPWKRLTPVSSTALMAHRV